MTTLHRATANATAPRLPAPRSASPARSLFGEWLVLRTVAVEPARGSGLSLRHAEDVARTLRNALLCHAVDPPPAALSGHTPDGRRLERPHVAFLVLPDLRPPDPSPAVAGVALVLPHGIDADERQAILLAAARFEQSGLRLVLGRLGALQLARLDSPPAGDALDPAGWVAPSRRWASVTPIALERNPGKLTAANPAAAARAARRAAGIVAQACAHIGLPAPTRVRVTRRSPFAGVPSAPAFMPFPRPHARRVAGPGADKFQRVCVHAELEFAEPVPGPLLLGAGRYFGVGLFGLRSA